MEPTTATLTDVERATVRNAVADHAAHYFGSLTGRDGAARYVAEGPLSALTDAHSLALVWRAVNEAIDADPSVLTRTQAQRDAVRAERAERIAALDRESLTAFESGNYARALELIDAAELIDPTHRAGGRFTWDEVRDYVRAADKEARRARFRDACDQTQLRAR